MKYQKIEQNNLKIKAMDRKKMDNERIPLKWDLNWFKQNNLLM